MVDRHVPHNKIVDVVWYDDSRPPRDLSLTFAFGLKIALPKQYTSVSEARAIYYLSSHHAVQTPLLVEVVGLQYQSAEL